MSNYTKATNFASKDALLTGNPLKIVKGTEIDNEFNAISTAVNSKFDTASLAAPGPIGATTPAAISGTTINGTTGTFSGNVQMASANGGQLAGLRNRIINGDMRVAQRGTTAVNLTSTSQFLADRFSAISAGTTPPTVSFGYSTDGSVSTSSGRHLFMQVSVAKGTLDPGNTTQLLQNIEGLNSADLLYGTASAKTVTVSFRARIQNLASAVIGVSIRNSASNRSYVAPVAITSANLYSVTIPGDTSGTWLTDTGVGLRLTFCIGAGSTFTAPTASEWQAGNYVATSTTTNTTGTATATLSISDVQLEVGPVATPFEQRPIGMELALCQRYFYQQSYSSTQSSTSDIGGRRGISWIIPFPASMRISPTVSSSYSGLGNATGVGLAIYENFLQAALASVVAGGYAGTFTFTSATAEL